MRTSLGFILAVLPSLVMANDVYVASAMVRLVRPSDLPRTCSTEVKVEACTAFAGQVLTCACQQGADGWRIEARAQFIPVMYLTGGDHVAHEREHISDVKAALARYVRDLEAMLFASAGECDATAKLQSTSFTRTMDQFKLDSNALRHPRSARALFGSPARLR